MRTASCLIFLLSVVFLPAAKLRGIRIGPPPLPVDVTSGLLARYTFDEGTGTNVADSSGNGNNGHFFVTNAPNNIFPTWTAGKIGSGALTFTRYECVETTNFADSLTNFTITCWYKIASDSLPGQLQMVNKFAAGINGAGWVLMNESGDISMAWGGATCYSEGGGDNHSDTVWNHVAACITGTNIVQWNNGTLVSQPLILTCSYSTFSNAGPVRIGWSGSQGGGDVGFMGSLDDVRIYNRALTSNEVQTLYNYR